MKNIEDIGERIVEKFSLDKIFRKEKKTKEFVELMYVREDKDKMLNKIWGKRVVTLIIVFLISIFAWIYIYSSKESESGVLKEGRYVERQSDTERVDLVVNSSGENSWEKSFPFDVSEKMLSVDEMANLEKRVEDYVKLRLPGKNKNLDSVEKKLVLVSKIPGIDASLKWEVDEDYIMPTGEVVKRNVAKEGNDIDLILKAKYKNWEKTYQFNVHLVPQKLTEVEKEQEQVKESIKKTLEDNNTKEVVELPKQIDGNTLNYSVKGEKKSYSIVYLCIGLLIILPVLWRNSEKKELEKRKNQLLIDYSGYVNKFMLLLGAGLTVRKVVERLVSEYENSRRDGGEIRYAYEESCVLLQEMNDGVSENDAIEHFGKRCCLLPYLRFSSVVTQNLKKGAAGILDILEEESLEAMKQRKEHVLQIGETAGTKLLLPMMVMLGIVIAIIMIPAFMTM